MSEELLSQLAEGGYQGRIVSIAHLGALQEELEGHYKQGRVDPELYRTYLAKFSFSPPEDLPATRSIIVVAVPQPQTRVTFTWDGEAVQYIIPPTYLERETESQAWELLTQVLEPPGYRVAKAILPKKLLAVRSGLAAYGKSNITYVPGMGSFHGLVVAFSDLPAPKTIGSRHRCWTPARNAPPACVTALPVPSRRNASFSTPSDALPTTTRSPVRFLSRRG
jgi:epoxyqueuosine reductase